MTPSPASNATARALRLRGDLLDFKSAPDWGAVDSTAVRFRPDHWLLIDGGQIVAVQPGGASSRRHVERSTTIAGRLILPGFNRQPRAHPQLDVIASYGTELLDWLNTYNLPAERRYADPQQAHSAQRASSMRCWPRNNERGGVPHRAQGQRRHAVPRRRRRAACGSIAARC